jgi:hypothetical protein
VSKRHGRTYEQQKYRDELAKTLEDMRLGWDADDFLSKEKMTEEYLASLWKDRFLSKQTAQEMIESWRWELVAKYLDNFRWLDHRELAQTLINRWEWKVVTDYLDNFDWAVEQLQPYLRHAYDTYLKAKRWWEHCPMLMIGDYVFAAWWFTCGHVDAVKVFQKKWVRSTQEVKVTKDAVNTLIEAGGMMETI